MLRWEYCILSGIETSLKRKVSVSLAFSGRVQASRNFNVELSRDHSEEMFTSEVLGDLGSEGWELVAFHRAPPAFEAVLKRRATLSASEIRVALGSNPAEC
jgi:hypothetical protein